ncbi:MAG: hypothetical protein HC896_13780 [Bacteroidales bacterium]|nr:hypothetical protein [Bacteroidales bacterium]
MKGTTEKGSSGSGLLNPGGQLIGTLSSGNSSDICGVPLHDNYVRFTKMWKTISYPNNQLQPWLDPDSTGATEVDGADPYESLTKSLRWTGGAGSVTKSLNIPGGHGYYTGHNSTKNTAFAQRMAVNSPLGFLGSK